MNKSYVQSCDWNEIKIRTCSREELRDRQLAVHLQVELVKICIFSSEISQKDGKKAITYLYEIQSIDKARHSTVTAWYIKVLQQVKC